MLPGVYRLRYRVDGRPGSTAVVVNGPADASDLTPLTPAAWQTMARRVGFRQVDPTPGAILAAVGRGRGGPDGWAVGVGGVLLLLAGESWLGRRWSGAAGRRVG